VPDEGERLDPKVPSPLGERVRVRGDAKLLPGIARKVKGRLDPSRGVHGESKINAFPPA